MKEYIAPEIELAYFEDIVELESGSYIDNEGNAGGFDEWWNN